MRTLRHNLLLAALTISCGLAALASPALAVDTVFGAVVKEQDYDQVGANTPVIDTQGGYAFGFHVLETSDTPDSVTGGSIAGPSLSTTALSQSGGPWWQYEDRYTSRQALDVSHPNGTYQLAVTPKTDTGHTFNLSLTGDSYPAAPYITNATAILAANPTSGFSVNWSSWSGSLSSDMIVVQIQNDANGDHLYSSPWPGQANTLSGSATSFTIPSGVLPSNTPLDVNIIFLRPVATDTTTYPGVPFSAAYVSSTNLFLPTPEPTSLALLALGGTALLIRRRKSA